MRSVHRSTRCAPSTCARSRPTQHSGVKELDIGLAADTVTLMGVPKLVTNVSLLHELALSARTFGVEEARRSLGLASRVAPCFGAEVSAAIVKFV